MNQNSYPLSYSQLALWKAYQLTSERTAYNVYSSVKIHSPLNLNVWRKVWRKIVQRHGIIRTTYTTYQGQPLQVIHSAKYFEPEIINVANCSKCQLDDMLIKAAERPFDLENGPVFRLSLFRQSSEAYIQLLAIHEIAGEMRSLNILTQEFQQLYSQYFQAFSELQKQESSMLSVASG